MQRTVLCMKWGTLYGAEYVNVLYSALTKNLSGDFRFVCLTDVTDGLADGIESYPIPDIGLQDKHWHGGQWPKLSVFSKELYGLSGRALFIDLDMMIVGQMDDFFTHAKGLVAIDEGRWVSGPPSTMTSIFAFDLGKHANIIDLFQANMDEITTNYRTDQAFLHDHAQPVSYWPEDWLISYKKHLRQPVLIDRLKGPKPPPVRSRVLVFHGNPRPIDVIVDSTGNLDKFPHYLSGPVDWAREYWLEHGGQL